MLSKKEIQERLQDVDPQLCTAFAVRCALRVLPFLVTSDDKKEPFWYWNKEECTKHLLAILTAQQVSVTFSAFGKKSDVFAKAATKASYDDTADVARATVDTKAAYVIAATAAAKATHVHAYNKTKSTITTAGKAAAKAAAFAAIFAIAATSATASTAANVSLVANSSFAIPISNNIPFILEIQSDLDQLNRGKINKKEEYLNVRKYSKLTPEKFLYQPLWFMDTPSEYEKCWQYLEKSLITLDVNFEIWVDWYKERMMGKPLDEELEEKWLHTPRYIRTQGVQMVNTYLRQLKQRHFIEKNIPKENTIHQLLEKTYRNEIKVFISYSHKDKIYKEELELCLKAIQRFHPELKYWEDQQLFAGELVDIQILEKLKPADIVVLLISRNFFASDYCFNTEMQTALKRFEEGKNVVIPIIIRSTANWQHSQIGKHVVLPRDGKPLNQWDHPDDFWTSVEEGIVKQIQRILGK